MVGIDTMPPPEMLDGFLLEVLHLPCVPPKLVPVEAVNVPVYTLALEEGFFLLQ